MTRASNAYPPRLSSFTPMAQPFVPQSYTPPTTMSYYGQQYQQGMVVVPMMNPHETGSSHPMWLPPAHFNPNYYPYYQQGQQVYGAPLPLEHYSLDPNHNFGHLDHPINEQPAGHAYADCRGHSHMEASGAEQTCWQSPVSQYMPVPQNSPALSIVDSVASVKQSCPPPGSQKPTKSSSPLKPTQPKRNRRTTFPGADPPILTFFEGSKKPNWSTSSSDSRLNLQQGGAQEFGSPKNDGSTQAIAKHNSIVGHVPTGNTPNTVDSRKFRGSLASQDARNFPVPAKHAQQQPHLPKHKGIRQNENRPPKYNGASPSSARAPTLARFRKPHFAQPSMIMPAIPNIRWVEMSTTSEFDRRNPGKFNCNGGPPPSVGSASLSPSSNSAGTVKRSSSLIPTSIPVLSSSKGAGGGCAQGTSKSPKVQPTPSHYFTKGSNQSSFTFNPKAADFVFAPEARSLKASDEDEYVGFYIAPGPKHPPATSEDIGAVTYDYDPMAWQLPSIIAPSKDESLKSCVAEEYSCGDQYHSDTVRKLPTEFIGKAPGNMNWNNKALAVTADVSRPRSWASWNSEDEAEVLERTIGTGFLSTLDEDKEKQDSFCKTVEIPLGVEAPSDTENQKFIEGGIQTVCGNGLIVETYAAQITDNVRAFEDKHHNLTKFPDSHTGDTMVIGDNAKYAGNDSEPTVENLGHTDDGKPSEEVGESHVQGAAADRLRDRPQGAKPGENCAQLVLTKKDPKIQPKQRNMEFGTLSNNGNKVPVSALALETATLAPVADSLDIMNEKRTKEVSGPAPAVDSPSTPGVVIPARVFNYRDALLKKVENPQTSVLPSSKSPPPKIAKVAPRKAVAPQTTTKPVPAKAETPSTKAGGRRKFFLHPIPTTATYDSITQHLKGGMLEDIYISGLSPHPSAWKGPKVSGPHPQQDNQLDGEDSKSWYCHVSFYSEEGARKFWKFVKSDKQSSSPYRSRYGGFDDQEPGFFDLDGTRVFVNWRHNDQRVVNPLTMKAVTQESATRCLLLTFNAEAATRNWSYNEKLGRSTKATSIFNERSFINKVATDIEIWGQVDSNLQGIHLLDSNTPEQALEPEKTAANPTTKPIPNEVKILITFIKILTAIKVKKYFSTQPEYRQDGYCKVEYYKDECSEPIDASKAIRKANGTTRNEESGDVMPVTITDGNSGNEPRCSRRNPPRAGKESVPGGNTARRNTSSSNEKNAKGRNGGKGTISTDGGKGGTGSKENESTPRRKTAKGTLAREKINDGKGNSDRGKY